MSMNIPASLDADIDRVFKIDADVASQQAGGDDEDVLDAQDTDEGGGSADADGDTTGSDAAASTDDPTAVDDLVDLPEPLNERPLRNEKGEIVDKDGRVIAGTKAEKRDFFNYNKLAVAANKLRGERDTAMQQLKQLQGLRDLPKSLGLTADQVTESLQFRARLEKDPIATVREIVATVVGNGYTMDQLFGPDAPAAINASIVQQQIDKHLGPIRAEHDAKQRESQVTQAAENDFNDFVESHEYADVHGNEIVALVQRDGITPQAAYYELKVAAARRGLDFTKPLIPQLQAAGGRGQQQTQRVQSARTTQRFLPGNRPAAAAVATQDNAGSFVASPDMSFKDIVANAFKTVGARAS